MSYEGMDVRRTQSEEKVTTHVRQLVLARGSFVVLVNDGIHLLRELVLLLHGFSVVLDGLVVSLRAKAISQMSSLSNLG